MGLFLGCVECLWWMEHVALYRKSRTSSCYNEHEHNVRCAFPVKLIPEAEVDHAQDDQHPIKNLLGLPHHLLDCYHQAQIRWCHGGISVLPR